MIFRFLRRLGLGWVAWRIFGPEPRPRFSPPQTRPLRIPGRTVFVGDREIFVREAGDPSMPPLVLVHGWSFDGEMTFFRIIPELAEDFRIIIADHRNHGRSEWVRGPFEIEDLADDLAAVLRALDIEDAMVFGYSLGGMVSQALAHRHPLLVGKLVLGATAAHPVAGRGVRVLSKVGFELGRALTRISTFELAYLSLTTVERTAGLATQHRRWLWTALLRRDPSLFYEAGHAAWRFDSRSWVGKLRKPTVVVVNDRDRVVPVDRQRELAALMPDAEVVVLADAGHESILAMPDRYIDVIRDLAKR